MSADGRYIVFSSEAKDLVPVSDLEGTETDRGLGLFVRDRKANRTARVSATSMGSIVGSIFGTSSITDDGRYVAFSTVFCTIPSCLPPHGSQYRWVLHDRATGQMDIVRHPDPSGTGDQSAAMSGDGTMLAWASTSTYVKKDSNNEADVYALDLPRPRLGIRKVDGSVPDGPSAGAWDHAGTHLAPAISSANAVVRPDLHDLFVRLEFERLPLVTAATYGTRITTAGGRTFELRAMGTPVPFLTLSRFELAECTSASGCVALREVEGGYGTIGESMVASIPLRALAIRKTTDIIELEAFARSGP